MTQARERRSWIADLVEDQREVWISDLAARFGLTDVSIRRDLLILEDQGRLKRVRGGAVAHSSRAWHSAYATKMRLRSAEKSRIGAVAAAIVSPGDVVLFDSGTTVAHVALQVPAALRSPGTLTVVTNSMSVIEELETWERPYLIGLGGLYLADHRAFVGPQTLAHLAEFSADIAFLGCDGLTREAGLTTTHVLVAEVGAATAARARRVVVVADSSKLGRQGFTPIIPLAKVDILITDASADPERIEEIRAAGVEVRLA